MGVFLDKGTKEGVDGDARVVMKAVEVEYDPEIPVIEAIQGGDPHAMAELVRRQGRWVRGVLFGVLGRLDDVDDVAQRVWMQVWRQARQLENPARWRVWLYRIARNAATDAGRHKQRQRRLVDEAGQRIRLAGSQENDRVALPEQRVVADEKQRMMLNAISALPPLYREPFVLRHLEDWTYRQIGDALGLPVDTVETRLVRARRLLREQLKGKL